MFWSLRFTEKGLPMFFLCYHEGAEEWGHALRQRDVCGDSWEGQDDLTMFNILLSLPLV